MRMHGSGRRVQAWRRGRLVGLGVSATILLASSVSCRRYAPFSPQSYRWPTRGPPATRGPPGRMEDVACPECRGTGRRRCNVCKGRGKEPAVDADCHRCAGNGWREALRCPRCRGSGCTRGVPGDSTLAAAVRARANAEEAYRRAESPMGELPNEQRQELEGLLDQARRWFELEDYARAKALFAGVQQLCAGLVSEDGDGTGDGSEKPAEEGAP